jgi:hypothetical protein
LRRCSGQQQQREENFRHLCDTHFFVVVGGVVPDFNDWCNSTQEPQVEAKARIFCAASAPSMML